MLTELLLLFIFVWLLVVLYFLYSKYTLLVKSLQEFKPVHNIIGKVPVFTQNQEDFLCANKDFLEAMIWYLDHHLALSNGKLHQRWVSNDDIQFHLGQCDAYISARGSMKTLLERKKKNDK